MKAQGQKRKRRASRSAHPAKHKQAFGANRSEAVWPEGEGKHPKRRRPCCPAWVAAFTH